MGTVAAGTGNSSCRRKEETKREYKAERELEAHAMTSLSTACLTVRMCDVLNCALIANTLLAGLACRASHGVEQATRGGRWAKKTAAGPGILDWRRGTGEVVSVVFGCVVTRTAISRVALDSRPPLPTSCFHPTPPQLHTFSLYCLTYPAPSSAASTAAAHTAAASLDGNALLRNPSTATHTTVHLARFV